MNVDTITDCIDNKCCKATLYTWTCELICIVSTNWGKMHRSGHSSIHFINTIQTNQKRKKCGLIQDISTS